MNSFKLAHLSDLHAGYKSGRNLTSSGLNVREADGYKALQNVVDDVIAHEVDAVVIAGDIYHTPTPEVRSIIFVQKQLRKLAQAAIPVYMLAGNHDTNDVKADIAASRIMHDPMRKIYSHVEPYVHYEIADGIHLHLVSHHMYSEQSETMNQIKPIPGEINIFSTHGSCIDPILEMKLKTEASPREIVIPDFLLNDHDWSYSMLGHIHERGWVGSDTDYSDTRNSKIYYNGSLIRRGFSDKECALGRGWTLWEIDPSGHFTPTMRTVTQRPQFDFATLDASELSSSELTDKIVENLRGTQPDSGEFIQSTAPILRQKVLNLTPSKKLGMDWKTIDFESEHALSWKVKPTWANETTNSKALKTLREESESTDVVSVYDSWVDSSESLKEVDSDLHSSVLKQTREFITLGQEKVFEDE